MDWRTFSAELVRALSWPLLVLAVILIFRSSLRKVIESLRSVERSKDGTRFSFGNDLSTAIKAETKIEARADQVSKQKYPQLKLSEKFDEIMLHFDQSIDDPKGAILSAWHQLMIFASGAMETLNIQKADPFDFQPLQESGVLIQTQWEVFRWMQTTAKKLEEQKDVEIESDDYVFAARYIAFSEAFISYFHSLKEIPPKWDEKDAMSK